MRVFLRGSTDGYSTLDDILRTTTDFIGDSDFAAVFPGGSEVRRTTRVNNESIGREVMEQSTVRGVDHQEWIQQLSQPEYWTEFTRAHPLEIVARSAKTQASRAQRQDQRKRQRLDDRALSRQSTEHTSSRSADSAAPSLPPMSAREICSLKGRTIDVLEPPVVETLSCVAWFIWAWFRRGL